MGFPCSTVISFYVRDEERERKSLREREREMGPSLDLSLVFVPKTISEFLGEISTTKNGSEKLSKLDDCVQRLEDERRKIEAFKRELPLCMLLLTDGGLSLSLSLPLCSFRFYGVYLVFIQIYVVGVKLLGG